MPVAAGHDESAVNTNTGYVTGPGTGRRDPPNTWDLSRQDMGRWALALMLAAVLHLSPLLTALPLSKVPEIETARAIEVEIVPPPKPKAAKKAKPPEKPKPPPQEARKPEPQEPEPKKPESREPEAKKPEPGKVEPKQPEPKKPAVNQVLPAPKKKPDEKKKTEPPAAKAKPRKTPKQTARLPVKKNLRAPGASTSKDPVANWLHTVRSKLRQGNLYPAEAQAQRLRGRVVVSFIIDKTGRVVDFWIARSSGSTILDRAAASALVNAVPFPRMPKEMNRQSIKLSYKVDFAPK